MEKIYIECEGKANGTELINNFPDVIKSIFVDEIGLRPGYEVDMCLDAESFEEAGNPVNGIRKDWKCDSVIQEIYSMDLISELSRESACVVMPNYLNNEKIIPLEIKTTSRALSSEDILLNKNGLPDITITKTGIENIFNSFTIRYRKSYINNKYMQMEFINKDETSLTSLENYRYSSPDTYTGLCSDSYQRYAKNAEYIIEAEYIRDRSTAIRLLKWFAEWLTRRRLLIEMKCVLNSNTIDLEVGDQVKLNIMILPAAVRNTHNFIITEMEINYLKGDIFLRLMEMSYPV
jgi:hypothetical protein